MEVLILRHDWATLKLCRWWPQNINGDSVSDSISWGGWCGRNLVQATVVTNAHNQYLVYKRLSSVLSHTVLTTIPSVSQGSITTILLAQVVNIFLSNLPDTAHILNGKARTLIQDFLMELTSSFSFLGLNLMSRNVQCIIKSLPN